MDNANTQPTHWTRYIIFVRPPGSHTWTQHVKTDKNGNDIPWSHSSLERATAEADRVSELRNYCVTISRVMLPRAVDEKRSVRLPDNDTAFIYAES